MEHSSFEISVSLEPASSRSTPRAITSSSTTPTRRCSWPNAAAALSSRCSTSRAATRCSSSSRRCERGGPCRRASSSCSTSRSCDIADGHGRGALEALLRWRDPDRGLLLPGAFLPFVEQTSLVGGDRRVGLHRGLPADRRVGQPRVQAEGQLQHTRAPAPERGLRRFRDRDREAVRRRPDAVGRRDHRDQSDLPSRR